MTSPDLPSAVDPDAPQASASAVGRSTKSFLIFRLAESWYAVPVGAVSEVVTTGEITRVPFAPPVVSGLMQIGGRIVVVLDGAQLLGGSRSAPQPPLEHSPRCVLLKTGDVTFAASVDELGGIVEVSVVELSATATGFAHGDRLITVVDPEALLAGAEAEVKAVT